MIEIAKRLADGNRPGVLGTVDTQDRPHLRWMATLSLQEFPCLYAISSAKSRKIEHIQAHPAVNWMFSNDEQSVIVNLMGSATIVTDSALVNRIWKMIENKSSAYFLSLQNEESNIAVIQTLIEDIQCVIPRYELKYYTSHLQDKSILGPAALI